MNILSKEDGKLFHKLMDSFLFYVNKRYNVIKNVHSKEEFFDKDIRDTIPLRNKMYKNPEIFDEFIKENPEGFSQEELSIISSWKKFKSGGFFLVKYTKEYTVFYNEKEKKAYGVLGIIDSFEEVFGGYAPILVETVLLPFKGKIVYEGILQPYNIHFGGGIKKSLKVDVGEAIQRCGLITNLEAPAEEKTASEEEMLRFYMGSRDKLNRYWDEINRLRKKSPDLEAIYYQEWAKQAARSMKKNLKSNGVKGHFAVLDEAVVASATTPKKLEENIKILVPEDKIKWIYKFKL